VIRGLLRSFILAVAAGLAWPARAGPELVPDLPPEAGLLPVTLPDAAAGHARADLAVLFIDLGQHLIAFADGAQYAAKRAGRNCVQRVQAA
jgi:hypothetical protein